MTAEHDDKREPLESHQTTDPLETTSKSEVEYLYLDFDTNLNLRPAFARDGIDRYPACPDLRKYDNPFDWPKSRKNLLTVVCCATNGVAAYAAGAYSAPQEQLTARWGVSDARYNIGLSVYTIGYV